MAVAAEWVGHCPACDEAILVGQPIVRVDGRWVHERCESERPREVCPTCFLQRPCECDDAA